MSGKYIARSDDIAQFQMPVPGLKFSEWMEKFGHTPIPPYINRDDDDSDAQRYQSVFARETGSCAAPTAGLHFTDAVLLELEKRGVTILKITLHVGPGTFKPIKTEDISDHTIDAEYAELSQSVWEEVLRIKKSGGRIFAVGSTSARALETAALKGGGFTGKTGLYIIPGFDFKTVDGLVTNFHLPGSSLIVLVSALAGREKILNAYKTAIAERYRFYSYGDAMLIT
jgi:S-adenosylmethionine:tRNA ribosyltransferase-isomerase